MSPVVFDTQTTYPVAAVFWAEVAAIAETPSPVSVRATTVAAARVLFLVFAITCGLLLFEHLEQQ
jgi:hypothetical protein